MEIQVAEMLHARRRIEELLAHHTGQDVDRVGADIERDYVVRGLEAVEYGLVDQVIDHREAASKTPVGLARPQPKV